MYYLKLDNIELLTDDRVLVTVGATQTVVPRGSVVTKDKMGQVPTDVRRILKRLDDIGVATSLIAELVQPSNLGHRSAPEPDPTPEKPPERQATQPVKASRPDLAALGLESSSELVPPFEVNEQAAPKMPSDELGRQLSELWETDPQQRRRIIRKVAGMIRLDMLAIKKFLSDDLRRAVVAQLMQRDALKTSIIPPDLAAFLSDKPLHETLGSRGWDPGSQRVKDKVSANWEESNRVQNRIAAEVDDSEFDHMYPTTQFAAVEVNRKFSALGKLE